MWPHISYILLYSILSLWKHIFYIRILVNEFLIDRCKSDDIKRVLKDLTYSEPEPGHRKRKKYMETCMTEYKIFEQWKHFMDI